MSDSLKSMGWKLVVTFTDRVGIRVGVEHLDSSLEFPPAGRPIHLLDVDDEEDVSSPLDPEPARSAPEMPRGPRQVRRSKRVAFVDDGAGWAGVAAALFQRMAHPDLATPFAVTVGGVAVNADRLRAAAAELGLEPARHVGREELPMVDLTVTLAELPALTADHRWSMSTVAEAEEELRHERDRLREKVWKLVARQGWYRMQIDPGVRLRIGRPADRTWRAF